jgi:hypothetical protein
MAIKRVLYFHSMLGVGENLIRYVTELRDVDYSLREVHD